MPFHLSRYTSGQLQSWKLALHNASFYTGEIINNQGVEQEAVKNVVNRVLKELKKDRLYVAKHRVGLDEAVQDFDEFALQFAEPIQIVGICGMGGSGKTILAKEIYNRKCSTIGKSSFLFDIREAAKKGLLHEKQKSLLEDLDLERKGADFDNVDKGADILKSCLRSVSVLIVLDDVDHIDQLDALLPASESLGHESLIIVTTRELQVLRAWDISTIYKIRSLNAAHAEELFCWHAFRQTSPLSGFEDLAKKFINACHGLPLSLKLLGCQLYGEFSENYWQSQLDKLSRMVPDDIKLRLKISYDALDKEEKEMFLDIACFFIGCRSSLAIAVWDGSGWNGMHGWQRLVNKCLVELDEDNLIRMHDHLRDLGREIANQQSPYRLWSPSQIIEIHPHQEAIRIRGMVDAIGDNCYPEQGKIIIHTSQGERSLALLSLGLKIFVGDGDFLSYQEHSEVSRELLWLRLNDFNHTNLPPWLSIKNLRVLELNVAFNLQELWTDAAHAPLQLRELIIDPLSSSFKKFPSSIGLLKHLKKIALLGDVGEEFDIERLPELSGCETLMHLPGGFTQLVNLQTLKISGCSLRELDCASGSLWNLRMINLSETHVTRISISADCCPSLEILQLSQFECLEVIGPLPATVRNIELSECETLRHLREGFTQLVNLRTLKISRCPLSELDFGFGSLWNLRMINLSETHVTRIAISGDCCPSLETLQLSQNEYLEEIEPLPTTVTTIELSECETLE